MRRWLVQTLGSFRNRCIPYPYNLQRHPYTLYILYTLRTVGSFRDRSLEEDINRANISDQITVQQSADAKSHTAGFDVRSPA